MPSGMVVQCQSERAQHQNRAHAFAMLRVRLYEAELQRREAATDAMNPTNTDIGWGHQIRLFGWVCRSAEPEIGSRAAAQFASQLGAERLGVVDVALAPAADLAAAVRLQHQPVDRQPVAAEFGEPGDRSAAGAVESSEHGAFGPRARGSTGVMNRVEQRSNRLVAGATLDREHTLADRRQHYLRRQDLGGEVRLAQPLEATKREHDRIELAFLQFSQSRVHVAAE